MLDVQSDPVLPGVNIDAEYDLVVIGAGVAGLNCLYASTHYLPKGAKVLLIDQKPAVGGMWNEAYDFVRLHQPHRMFTVGDLPWKPRRPARYLAKRDEVRAHLETALEPIGRKFVLSMEFNKTARFAEIETADGPRAEIRFHPNDAPDDMRVVRARQCIFSPGHNTPRPKPLSVSSEKVISVAPQGLTAALAANPGAPIYVVGGGKTGMDVILNVASEDPSRKIELINGSGTNFMNRDKIFPKSYLAQWTGGTMATAIFRELSMGFDGTNGDEIIARFRSQHSTDVNGTAQKLLFAFQSEAEARAIAAALDQTHQTYFTDISDGTSGPVMSLSDGSTHPVAPGSIVVNCTGTLFRVDDHQEEVKCLSQHGTILTVNLRDGFMLLGGPAAFFLTHLHYRDKLRGNGFYTLDHEVIFRHDRNVWVGAAAAQAYMNIGLSLKHLPLLLCKACGLDMDAWYPLPRRLFNIARMQWNASTEHTHCRSVLDRVGATYELTSGEIN